MSNFAEKMRRIWAVMIQPPWKYTARYSKEFFWVTWVFGWIFALGGLWIGALVAASLVQAVGLESTSYVDWVLIAIAVLVSVLFQLVVYGLGAISNALEPVIRFDAPRWQQRRLRITSLVFDLGVIALVSLLFFRFGPWIVTLQRSVPIAFVGGLLVKTIIIPSIKGTVTGTLLKWFVSWLRGGKETKKATY
jgi:hypothetical protein